MKFLSWHVFEGCRELFHSRHYDNNRRTELFFQYQLKESLVAERRSKYMDI